MTRSPSRPGPPSQSRRILVTTRQFVKNLSTRGDHLADAFASTVDDRAAARSGRSTPSAPRNVANAGACARLAPSSLLRATPSPSGFAAQRSPSAPPFASQPGAPRMRRKSAPSGPPTRSGRARIAAAMRSPPGNASSREYAWATRSSGSAKVTMPHPSLAASRARPLPPRHETRGRPAAPDARAAVALRRPAAGTTESEHPGVVSRAVVVHLLRRPTLLDAELEIVLRRLGPREQRTHGGHLLGRVAMGGARDRKLVVRQVVAGSHER